MKNKMIPSVAGVGYLGGDKYKKNTKCYWVWSSMIKRVFGKKVSYNYKDVTIEKEWFNLQNFGKWFDKNYVEGYHLDKDLKIPGEKHYSPDSCLFVPQSINNLFHESNQNKDFPLGVKVYGDRFIDCCSRKEFSCVENAKESYWISKQIVINNICNEYKEFEDIIQKYFLWNKSKHNSNLVFRKISKLYVRPNTSDDLVIDESIDYLPLLLNAKEKDTVLEIGGNIGSVSSLFSKEKNKLKIISYEPEINNFNVLKKNTEKNKNITIINAAVGDKNGIVSFYINDGGNKGRHSVFKIKGYRKESVYQFKFEDIIKNHKPNFIKCDIEGGEYKLNLNNLPKRIKGIAIEIHKMNNNWQKMKELYENLHSQFSYEIGDIPKNDYWYIERDCFMCIFLRNEK